MGRPYGLLRAGFPFHKTLSMRRTTNFPIDIAIGKEGTYIYYVPERWHCDDSEIYG